MVVVEMEWKQIFFSTGLTGSGGLDVRDKKKKGQGEPL